VKVTIARLAARLRSPLVSARGATEVRELLLLRLETGAGATGFGEAAPLEHYDGVSLADCRAALEDCRGILARGETGDRAELLEACRRAAVLPQALAAVDLALWDLAGRQQGQPVWRLLGAAEAAPTEVNHTISSPDRAGAAAEALRARASGYRTVKVKVGTGDDAGRLAAVRAAAGPEVAIRLDANGAWSVPEARAALRALEPSGVECCEEPVHGLDALAELSVLTEVALSMDETAALPGALDRRVCTAACLKISRCGGISGVLDAAARARAAGYEVYLASTLDGPLGIAAALHAAAVIVPERASGLATLGLFAEREAPLSPREGYLAPPRGAGLGDGLTGWYER